MIWKIWSAMILAPMSDRLVWSLESSGEFTVASVRKLIDDKWLPGADNKTRWIKYVPIKINVHAWKVMSDSIPARFNISRRGISIDSLSCVLFDNGDVPEAEFESYAGWLDWFSAKEENDVRGSFLCYVVDAMDVLE
uniref:RNA-directed DNA polymerase, eukaryota n=1 Tax=Tanacetum cinerariifolium TaxID=118510 RepID=A0A6L2N4S0_TANCI|nr:RNA-directed DNA polymerase, eukaryota [Tanacetum cinerariifolium]